MSNEDQAPVEEPDAEPEPVERSGLRVLSERFDFPLFWLTLLAVLVGLLAAYGSNLFRAAFELLGGWLTAKTIWSSRWLMVPILAAAGLGFGLVLSAMNWQRFRGPAYVILAVHERGGRITWPGSLATAICDALSLAVGASVGRYGPAVVLGGALGSLSGQIFRLSRGSLRVLTGCGVAAAISASFNAPIAGAIFAHEVIIGNFALRSFAPIAVASVTAVGITRWHGFEYILLKFNAEHSAPAVWHYPAFAAFGAAAAVIAMLYMHGLLNLPHLLNKISPVVPRWAQPAIGGALAGAIGVYLPQVLGLGDGVIQDLLGQSPSGGGSIYGIPMLIALLAGKLAAAILCLGSRWPGGVFSPALFAGAMFGGLMGLCFPALSYPICVLVGMGAMVSCVVGAPIATILIVFELTEDYAAATAVMIAVVAANAIVTRWFARSLFHRQIRLWGYEIDRPHEQRFLEKKYVKDLMDPDPITVDEDATVKDVRGVFRDSQEQDLFVVDSQIRLLGRIEAAWLFGAGDEASALSLCRKEELWLLDEESLWQAERKIESFVGKTIPVVDSAESMRLIGSLPEGRVIAQWREAVEDANEERRN